MNKVTRYLRNGYKTVGEVNRWANGEAGVPEAIRKTTIKPGGTVPKLVGRTSGMSFPTFKHTLRRTRIQMNSPMYHTLIAAGVPHEKDLYSANTEVFEHPILQGPSKPAEYASLWEQAMLLVLLQREWADNAVSNTLNFRPKWPVVVEYPKAKLRELEEGWDIIDAEGNLFYYDYDDNLRVEDVNGTIQVRKYDPQHEEDIVEAVLSFIAPFTKSVALLPWTTKGVYKQMPEEGISEDEYLKRLDLIRPVDWSTFKNSDGQDEKFCTGDKCLIG